MTNEELLQQRADIALADLESNGGKLSEDQSNEFFDLVVDQPTLIKQARFVRMTSPSMKINRIAIGSRILHKAPQGTPPFAADDGTNSRHLAASKRWKPTTSFIRLNEHEKIAEIHIPYDVLEDNIEGRSFEAHLMRLMAERVSLDLEEWALNSDTGSDDPDLNEIDGFIKLATSNQVDLAAQLDIDGNALNSNVHPGTFTNGMLAMPDRFRRDKGGLRHFMPPNEVIKYRGRVSQRATGYGDSVLTSDQQLKVMGVLVEEAPMMPEGHGLLTYPKNMVIGTWRQIMVETDKDIRAREIIIVLTMRVGLGWDTEEAVVHYKNIGA